MLIIGFPSNPTAQCVELDFFEKVMALARQHDILVVHDLAYADITFDGWKAPSIMQVPGARDVAVEFFTMSKSYNMAGWRIGFMVGNTELVNALARIKSYHDYGTFTPLQVAAIAALEGPQECVEEIRRKYQKRRDVMVKGLHEAGWMVENPKASMYVWAKIPEQYRAHGLDRVREEAPQGREGRGLARHRLRRLRRRPRAHRADREREPHRARRCAASRRCSGRTASAVNVLAVTDAKGRDHGRRSSSRAAEPVHRQLRPHLPADYAARMEEVLRERRRDGGGAVDGGRSPASPSSA